MATTEAESMRAQLIRALEGEVQKVPQDVLVAGGVWDFNGLDHLQLYVALVEPGEDLRNQDYPSLARRLNLVMNRIREECNGPTGNWIPAAGHRCPPKEDFDPAVYRVGLVGYWQYQEPALPVQSLAPQEAWRVLRYETDNASAARSLPQLTEVLFYPHPLTAEIQSQLYDQQRKMEDERWKKRYYFGERFFFQGVGARPCYRISDRVLSRLIMETAAQSPVLLENVYGLDDTHRQNLQFSPFKPYRI